MSSEISHFKVGAFECIVVSDGIHTYAPPTFPPPTTFLFGNVPRNYPDPISGITLDDGELAFPNARFKMWNGEWDFRTSGDAETKLDEKFREVLLGLGGSK